MAKYPQQITIQNEWVCMDGGSLDLWGHDEAGRSVHIYLGWSIEQQKTNMTEFCVNGTLLLPASEGEAAWLRLLKSAINDSKSDHPQTGLSVFAIGGIKIDMPNTTIAGPYDADHIVTRVQSQKHQSSRARQSVMSKIVSWIFHRL